MLVLQMTNLELLFVIVIVRFISQVYGALVFITLRVYSILVGSKVDKDDNALLRTKEQKAKYRDEKLGKLEKLTKR